MKKIFALLFVLAIIIQHKSNAQQLINQDTNNSTEKNRKGGHGLGLILSASNGKGLCYRYWPGIYGVQVSFVPAATENNQYYNGGFTGYARIKRYSLGDLFMHVGTEYVYRSELRVEYDYQTGGSYDYKVRGRGLNVGFGPGFHVSQKGFSFDIYAGYGGYLMDEWSTDERAQLNDRFVMTFTGGLAIFLDL